MGLTHRILNLLEEKPTIISNTVVGNWNTGVATSGNAGADLVTISTPGQWTKVSDVFVVLTGFNALAIVTIRAYMLIAGIEREVMDDNWTIATADDIAFVTWFFEAAIYGTIRMELNSNILADDGFGVTYEYKIKYSRW